MTKTSAEVRTSLIDALRLDLIGPGPHDLQHAEEVLPQAPSSWYLGGFLVPFQGSVQQRLDDTSDDNLDTIDRASPGDDENTGSGNDSCETLPLQIFRYLLPDEFPDFLYALVDLLSNIFHRPLIHLGPESPLGVGTAVTKNRTNVVKFLNK